MCGRGRDRRSTTYRLFVFLYVLGIIYPCIVQRYYRCIIVCIVYRVVMLLLLSSSLYYSPSKTQESSPYQQKPLHKDNGGLIHTKNEEEVRKHANTYYALGKTRSTLAKGIASSQLRWWGKIIIINPLIYHITSSRDIH